MSGLSVAKCLVTGTPDEVIPRIEVMAQAGVDHIAFGHCPGLDFDEALDLLGREELPHFKR